MTKIFQQGDYVAVHENPVWRDKADFIIQAYLGQDEGRNEWEQLWAKKLEDRKFCLCCIPFFADNLALGDELETDDNYVVLGVVRPSGHFTFRVWFGESKKLGVKEDVLHLLETMGALVEWSSANLLAVSATGGDQAQQIADVLYTRQSDGYLIYETGRK